MATKIATKMATKTAVDSISLLHEQFTRSRLDATSAAVQSKNTINAGL
jgi:hypothetical protein